jgi:hypothetical protein
LKTNFEILTSKLDEFIRKYYKNQLIKGGIYCLSVLVIFFLLVNLLEYFGQFDTLVRTVIFYVFIGLNLIIILKFLVIPLTHLFKMGKTITYDMAAEIIGRHFPEVGDKITNALQLKRLVEKNPSGLDLINAGIDQKITKIKPVPFSSAIDLKGNKKYLKYAIPPLLILLFLLVSAPNTITDPTTRLVKHNVHFEKELPFQLVIMNDELKAVQNEDFQLNVKVEGEESPDQVFLEFENNRNNLIKENTTQFSYSFTNIQKDIRFKIVADPFISETYTLKMLPKPILLNFEVAIDYPAYTGKNDETIHNNGELIVPEGTEVTWNFSTRNTDKISLRFSHELEEIKPSSGNIFTYQKKIKISEMYSIISENEYLTNSDSLVYAINALPDLYPTIAVEEFRDTVFDQRLYFRGNIKDDYGFDRLSFSYKVLGTKNREIASSSDKLPFNPGINPQQFYHFFDLSTLNIMPGETIEYYFEVWDNDRINGSKSTRSEMMRFKVPTLDEIEKQEAESNQRIKSEMEEAIDEVKQLQKEIEQLNRKLFEKNNLSWEDRQQVQELLDKQKELKEKLESINEENIEKSRKEEQYRDVNEEILQKQQQLEEMFERLMEDEEFEKFFKDLQELLDEVDKDKVNKMLDEMKMSNEDLEKQLDRNLELFKQLEFEKELEETIERLEKLSEKQHEISEKTEDKKTENEELLSEQEEINEEFDQLKEKLDALEELNEQLEDPNEFDQMDSLQDEIDQDMEDSMNSLQNNKKKNASQSQKNASEKMKQMAESLLAMQQQMVNEGMTEDIDDLRDILENLIKLSFDQEKIMTDVSNINLNDPQVLEIIQEQKNLKDDLKMVEDSLYALSKRQIMIQPFVNKEITSINENIDKAIDLLNNRNKQIIPQAASRQQYVMTSINNLALMLSESLNQMMMQMNSSSSSSCKSGNPKPGAGQPSLKSLRQMQEQLNQQMEGMKKGDKDSKGKQGSKGQSLSEQLARTAAQQEAIRGQMQKYAEELEKQGQFGASKELKKIMEDMEKTETDLVNKRITEQTLMRQKEILTRLLESEKAEMEREKEEKRESREGKIEISRNPKEILEYNKQQTNEVELLKTMPPTLKPFYKSKVNQYFYNFEELLKK